MATAQDFLMPKLLQDGAELATQWSRFKEEFDYYLIAAEKSDKEDKIKIAILLRTIGPRGVDIFKSFKFGEGESKDVYKDVLGKFDNFCKKTSNKIIKRHQLLSTKQECLSIDEYVTNLHKIARECDLGDMYDDFFMQALLLGINDEQLRRKLFEESENIDLEKAIKKCKLAESSQHDMKAIKAERESIHTLGHKSTKANKSVKQYLHTTDKEANNPTKSNCENCGNSHPPRKCPAYWQTVQ